MLEALFLKYSISAGVLVVCVCGIAVTSYKLRKKNGLMKKITLHGLQAIFICAFISILSHYVIDLVRAYHLQPSAIRIVNLITISLIALVVLRKVFMLINLMEKYQINKGREATSARLLARILKITLAIMLLFLFGEHFGLSLSGLLAFGGIGGIAIGMASKDILSNFFSGAMLFYDRQFDIGDWVSSPDREIEGTVAEIGWRITKIITFDNRPLYVPNAAFSSISVQNPGRMTNRRINTEIGLRYDDADKIEVIVADIRSMLQSHEAIDTTQTILVYFNAFADSSLNIMVYCFTKTTEWAKWLEAQQHIYLKIIEIVHQHGADFAFPTQTLYMNAESK